MAVRGRRRGGRQGGAHDQRPAARRLPRPVGGGQPGGARVLPGQDRAGPGAVRRPPVTGRPDVVVPGRARGGGRGGGRPGRRRAAAPVRRGRVGRARGHRAPAGRRPRRGPPDANGPRRPVLSGRPAPGRGPRPPVGRAPVAAPSGSARRPPGAARRLRPAAPRAAVAGAPVVGAVPAPRVLNAGRGHTIVNGHAATATETVRRRGSETPRYQFRCFDDCTGLLLHGRSGGRRPLAFDRFKLENKNTVLRTIKDDILILNTRFFVERPANFVCLHAGAYLSFSFFLEGKAETLFSSKIPQFLTG